MACTTVVSSRLYLTPQDVLLTLLGQIARLQNTMNSMIPIHKNIETHLPMWEGRSFGKRILIATWYGKVCIYYLLILFIITS